MVKWFNYSRDTVSQFSQSASCVSLLPLLFSLLWLFAHIVLPYLTTPPTCRREARSRGVHASLRRGGRQDHRRLQLAGGGADAEIQVRRAVCHQGVTNEKVNKGEQSEGAEWIVEKIYMKISAQRKI